MPDLWQGRTGRPQRARSCYFPDIYRTRAADAGTGCFGRADGRQPRDSVLLLFFLLFTGRAPLMPEPCLANLQWRDARAPVFFLIFTGRAAPMPELGKPAMA